MESTILSYMSFFFLQNKGQEIEAKEKVIGERDEVVKSLTSQLEEQTRLLEDMEKIKAESTEGQLEVSGISFCSCV